MNKLFTLICVLYSFILNAQVENALQFDDIDDNITVTNASALIANSTNISMSCWVNPQNANPVFPNLDGFCGFRDDAFADFYLVQVNATHVEARFRNSTGAAFSMDDSSLQVNVWQHYVLTYDGSYMRLYYNGVFKDSLAASGSIASTTATFNIGNLIYSFNNFYLKGAIDEVSLWNTTLQPSDIKCIYKSYIDSTSAGLQLYYKFNQGVAGMSNIGIDTLNPSAGNLPGVLNNFALSGQTSNWVFGKQNSTTATDVFCPGTPYIFGSQSLNAAGLYTETFTDMTGCDSVARLILYPVLSDSVSIYADSLFAYQSNAIYQWLDCNNGYAPIPGETNRHFSPAISGNYAVKVEYNNCTDTSACVNFTPVSIEQYQNNSGLTVYPNPVNDQLRFRDKLENVVIEITDPSGKKVLTQNNFSGNNIDISFLQSGIYFVTVRDKNKSTLVRITKL